MGYHLVVTWAYPYRNLIYPYTPSFHVIFHFPVHLSLHFWGVIFADLWGRVGWFQETEGVKTLFFSLLHPKNPGGPKLHWHAAGMLMAAFKILQFLRSSRKMIRITTWGAGGWLYHHHDYTGMQDIMTVLSSGLACMR